MLRKASVSGKQGCCMLLPLIFLSSFPFSPAAFAEGALVKPAAGLPSVSPRQGLKIDEVNDVGYTLQRIRQQAINIYVEAIRKVDSPAVTAELPSLTRVPSSLPHDMSHLLPFRRPWLVYFIVSLEPLVHLLKQEVKDIGSGAAKFDVEPPTRKAIEPLIQEWSVSVGKVDEYMAEAVALIEDSEKSNVQLAELACKLDAEVSKLEVARDKCFIIVEQMEKKWKRDKGIFPEEKKHE